MWRRVVPVLAEGRCHVSKGVKTMVPAAQIRKASSSVVSAGLACEIVS
jgi:hypothetical protein